MTMTSAATVTNYSTIGDTSASTRTVIIAILATVATTVTIMLLF